jgi:6-pyruvoyltetrahydropterin/6-carboxytetrahydropterin synthase
MYLTANRRLPFSASRRLARDGWSADDNERVYGAGRERLWGTGANYEAHIVLEGDVTPPTGMLVNLTAIKDTIGAHIDRRYDHRFLNVDTPPFDRVPPTPENLARQLLAEAQTVCPASEARPVVCHVAESPATGAIAYASGVMEREYALSFSAARRTWSPHLSEEENLDWFGRAALAEGHGHGYRLRVVLGGTVDEATGLIVEHATITRALNALHGRLDHRNLNVALPEFRDQPMTTESLARFLFEQLAAALPVARVRLHEMPTFFAEYDGSRAGLGLERSFSAAHCLRRADLSDEENQRIFGKCANPNGHGHRYQVQALVAGPLDERTGTLFNLERFDEAVRDALDLWDQCHLDLDTDDFRDSPSTGENIACLLWPRLDTRLDSLLVRLRLFETDNNRFTLRLRKDSPWNAS